MLTCDIVCIVDCDKYTCMQVYIIFILRHLNYTSRCVFIKFSPPALDIKIVDNQKLPPLLNDASKAVGAKIALGEKFVKEGVRDMDENLIPRLRELIGKETLPRVLPSYTGFHKR